jgi:hypothetical protein
MDGFIYQQVSPSAVPDLTNMSKEVYELHEDNSESLVENGIVNESSTYGIEVGFLDDLEAKAMFLGINKGLGLSTQSDEPEEVDYARPSYNDLYNFVDELMVEGHERATSILRRATSDEPQEVGLGDYKTEDFDAMLETLDVAMDEFNQLHNHSRSDDYYENHMTQLDNIINLINKLK